MYLSTGSTSYRKSTHSFLGYESKLSLVFEMKRREKTIVILFQKYKGVFWLKISRPPEEFKVRQRAPTLFLSR